MADIGDRLYAACVEVYVLDSSGNVRSFPPALSEGGETAFTRVGGPLRWGGEKNILSDARALNWATQGERVIVWSGSLSDDLFGRDPGTWGPRGLEALRSTIGSLASEARAGGFEVWLRPHARHVLCDVQRAVRLLHEWRDLPVGLALDAASMLETSMAGEAEDHFRRAYEALGPLAKAVIVANARVAQGDEESPIELVGVGEGLVRPGRLLELLAVHVPPEVPRIALDEADAQLLTMAAGSR